MQAGPSPKRPNDSVKYAPSVSAESPLSISQRAPLISSVSVTCGFEAARSYFSGLSEIDQGVAAFISSAGKAPAHGQAMES